MGSEEILLKHDIEFLRWKNECLQDEINKLQDLPEDEQNYLKWTIKDYEKQIKRLKTQVSSFNVLMTPPQKKEDTMVKRTDIEDTETCLLHAISVGTYEVEQLTKDIAACKRRSKYLEKKLTDQSQEECEECEDNAQIMNNMRNEIQTRDASIETLVKQKHLLERKISTLESEVTFLKTLNEEKEKPRGELSWTQRIRKNLGLG